MKFHRLTAADADIITRALTKAQAVRRIDDLRATVLPARTAAMAKCPPGMSNLAQMLMLYDDGCFTAAQTLASMRHTLDLHVIEGSRELCILQAALYQGRFRDTASESAAGG